MCSVTNGGSVRFSLFFFLTLCLITALALLTKGNNDIWHHLKTGEYIVSGGSVPHEDIYSFTAEGRRWVYHSWLSAVIFHLFFKNFSFAGLIILRVCIILGTGYFCFLSCRLHKISDSTTAFLLTIFGFSSWQMFILRPHLFSYLFLSVYLYILESYRLGKGKSFILLPFLQLLWTNLHGASLLGLLLICIYTVGLFHRLWVSPRAAAYSTAVEGKLALRGWGKLLFLSFASLLIYTINPNGLELFRYALRLSSSKVFSSIVYEWHSPFNVIFSKDFFAYFYSEWLFLAIFSFFIKIRKKGFFDAFLIFIFVYLSSRAIRHIALSMIFLSPFIAVALREFFVTLAGKWNIQRTKVFAEAILSVALIYSVFHIAIKGLSPGKGWEPSRINAKIGADMPVDAVNYILENDLPGEVLNSYDFGSYLIFRFFPDRKVYIDGRIAMYGEDLARELMVLNDVKLDKIIKEYGIKTALISKGEPSRIHNYFLKRNFICVYSDRFASIYTRVSG